MTVVAEQVSVTTSATLLVEGDRDGLRVAVRNRDADPVFIGGADVTTGEGFQLDEGESASLFIDSGDDVYGICAAGTARVDTLVSGAS
jgi:hypothetical protein